MPEFIIINYINAALFTKPTLLQTGVYPNLNYHHELVRIYSPASTNMCDIANCVFFFYFLSFITHLTSSHLKYLGEADNHCLIIVSYFN